MLTKDEVQKLYEKIHNLTEEELKKIFVDLTVFKAEEVQDWEVIHEQTDYYNSTLKNGYYIVNCKLPGYGYCEVNLYKPGFNEAPIEVDGMLMWDFEILDL